MNATLPPTGFVGWEYALTRRFLMVGDDGDASPIRSFGITPEGLAAAAGLVGGAAGAEALASFKSSVCRGGIADALEKGNYPSGMAPGDVPGCFAYLVVTLLAANLPTEGAGFGGDFRGKLTAFVGTGQRLSKLHGVAKMWLRLREWLEARRGEGRPFRSLILPQHPEGWIRIGYTLRLAFPTKPDATLLKHFLIHNPELADDPRAFVRTFAAALARGTVSAGLEETFTGFRDAFEKGERMLANHPFWRLVEACKPTASIASAPRRLIQMTFDEDGQPIFSVLDPDGLEATPGPLGLREAAAEAGAPHGISGRGLLAFAQAGYNAWTCDGELPGGAGTFYLGCAPEALARLREHRTLFRPCGHWHLTANPIGASAVEACAGLLGLRPVGDRLSIVSVHGGIRSGGVWLGRTPYLPRVDAGPARLRILPCGDASGPLVEAPNLQGRLTAPGPVQGAWLIEPDADERAWSRRVSFTADAVPHENLPQGPLTFAEVVDWMPDGTGTASPAAMPDGWAAGDPRMSDLQEAVYAHGRSGLPEQILVRLVEDAFGRSANPWTVMRILRDASFVQPRLRPGWKGRVWTLRPPCIRRVGGAYLLDGAVCERLAVEFRNAAAAEGGRPFRAPGAGDLSPPLTGSVGGDMVAVAARLGWDLLDGTVAARGRRLGLVETALRVLDRQPLYEWDWELAGFATATRASPSGVRLRRWIQPGGNDHDVYTVDGPDGTRRRYVSRIAAVLVAHCLARVPAFEAAGGLLRGLFPEASLPDALAWRLRLRHAENPGIAAGNAAYRADSHDLALIEAVLPGMIGDRGRSPAAESVALVRHSRRGARLGWVGGTLGIAAAAASTGDERHGHMMGYETELVGRIGRMAGANAPVFPLAERGEDGAWRPLEDAKVRFPPSGKVELLSAIAFRIREGDLIVFHTAAANTYRAANRSRAVGVRKLVRFLNGLPDADAEGCRRLLVEAGLDDVQAGDWVVKAGPGAVTRVTLAQGTDGRWRAAPSPRLILRRFDAAYAVDGSVVSEPGSFYDLDAAERIADVADWSRDADFLTAAANAVPLGEDHSRLLADLVERYSDTLTGRISAVGGHDPQTAADLVRSGALAARLREEGAVLAAYEELVRADAALQELVDREAAARAEAEMPALAAAARAEIETEMEAARAAAVAQVRAVVEQMEADELAALEERRARSASDIEAKLKDRLEGGMAEVEAAFASRRAELSGEVRKLDGLLRTATAEVERLDAQRSELEKVIAAMAEKEAALVGRVESLARSEEALAARPAAARPVQRFTAVEDERRLALSEVGEAVAATRLLTGDGVDAVVRFAVLAAAGEVPILVGGGARDFLDVAALVLSGGRLAVLAGDPTTITFEDLWTRAGGNGPTVLADAAQAAAAGLPILGAVTGADASGGRFWFPALADARRAGALPAAMMLCVTVDDPDCEEAERLLRGSFRIDADGLVRDGGVLLAPAVFNKFAREPMSLELPGLADDPAAAMAVLSGLGGGLTLNAARRLARLHAAASSARGEAGAEAAIAAFKDELVPRQPAPASSAPKLSFLTGRG